MMLLREKSLVDESLLSFLLRLCKLNSTPLITFVSFLKSQTSHHIQKSDFSLLDRAPNRLINMDALCRLTNCSIDQVQRMTLMNVLRIFSHSESLARARFLSGMTVETIKYCPQCLKDSAYLRLIWRLSGTTHCVDHHTTLHDSCPDCRRPIQLKDVNEVGVCPYCGFVLSGKVLTKLNEDSTYAQQKWWKDAWIYMNSNPVGAQSHDEISAKLLYVLNGNSHKFHSQHIESALQGKNKYRTLLQHARDSLASMRSLHLSTLLDLLYAHGVSMKDFFSNDVPVEFKREILDTKSSRIEKLACQAPWCPKYKWAGSLVKSGTSVKRLSSGETLVYYSLCPECGCEYALNDQGKLVERTYFIDFYKKTYGINVLSVPVKYLSQKSGLTNDKVKRCIAYFSTYLGGAKASPINMALLQTAVQVIKHGGTVKEVQRLSCWTSYNHFLQYRYHPAVMAAIRSVKRSNPPAQPVRLSHRDAVSQVLETFISNDVSITIRAVCGELAVCPETLRHWGCLDLIRDSKKKQSTDRSTKMTSRIRSDVHLYFQMHERELIHSRQVYQYLGITRSLLWKIDPQLTGYISHCIRIHNARANDNARQLSYESTEQ